MRRRGVVENVPCSAPCKRDRIVRGPRMPDPIELPRKLRARGWKVKIYDKERLEPPHVTLLRRERVRRIGLRDGGFLVPPGGRRRDIDPEVRAILEARRGNLRAAWDAKCPANPVSSSEGQGDGEQDDA